MQLDVGVETSANGVVRLVLTGELDISNAHQVHEAVPSAECVVVDLSGLTFVDSAGIRLILQLEAASERDGWQLRIVPGPDEVQGVFRLVGLEERLPFLKGKSKQ